jgi:predicted nicotinamide N-methyase
MEFPPPPDDDALERLLGRFAPLGPAPLCPELLVYQAPDLYALWGAAEELVGAVVSPPFWATPWPAGVAIARVLLDAPVWARGRRCLDVGVGGGVVAIAAAKAGAKTSVGADLDPWALAVARLAARKNKVELRLVLEDLAVEEPDEPADLILAADLEYEKERSPLVRRRLDGLVAEGAVLLVADAGRTFFKTEGLRLVASFTLPVDKDVEGLSVREARVYSAETNVG